MADDIAMDRLDSVVTTASSASRISGEIESDEDGEYEFLDMSDVDEDYLDSGDLGCSDASVLNKIPFAKIHQDPIPFDDSQRKCFLPGQRISIKVVNAEPAENGRLLNPNMYLPGLPILFQEYRYVVQVNHGDYEWIVRRRYKHFRQIHEHLVLMRAGAKLPVPTARHRERRKSLARNKHTLPKFPKRPDPLVRVEHLEKRKKELGDYLESILRHPLYRKDQEVLRFLEVSHLSFVNGLGQKGKEGIVQKRAGGRKIALHWCLCMRGCTPTLHWNKTWLLVKDTFVAYVRPQDGTIRDVLLMDQDFVVECGLMKTGIRHGLMISNLTRELLLKCWTQRKAREWQEQILNTMQRAADFTEPNRFGSFAPVRKDAYTTWFVDGATYMAAVADGIEAAKEEIFITDWWLSPEIYLKRPKVDDDERWRLDIMLKKKACEGVKIYIQIYKELEVALGINSYYSKQALMKLHPTNIKVMRHPDGINLWSHHEKSVIIDQRLAFMGGIDLCYGRWDTRLHRLTDLGSESLSQFYGEGETKTAQMSPTPPRAFPKDTKRVAFDSGLDTIAESQQSLDAPAIVIERVDSGRTEDTLLSEAGDGEDDVVGRDTEAGIDEVDTETVEAQGETNGSYINHSAETDNGDLVIDNHEPGTSGEEDLQHSDDEDGDAVPTQSGEVSEELVEIAITDGDPTQDNSGDEGETPSSSSKKLTISRQTRVAEDSPASPHRDISGESPDSEPCSPEVSTSENAPSDPSETNEPIENDGAKESHSTDQNDNEMCGREEARVAPGDAEMSRDDSIESISGIATFKSFLSSLSNQTYDILHEAVEQHAADTAVEEEGSEDITPEAKPKVKSRFRSPRLHLNMPHMTKSRREGSPDASPANSPKGGRRDLGGGESQGSLTTPDSDGFLGAPGKPTTPTMAKKKFGQALRERFRKQKSMSIDITEERPHDDDVYNRKEMESTSDPHQILGDESGNFKLWVGKDYVNFIFKDLVELDKPFTDFVDRTVTARMPWHDIGAACFGRPARDVARHFIQRWNFCKLQKQKDNMEFPMLLPKAYSNITVPSWVSQSTFTANCQILRSSSEWSAGIKITEASIQDAYIQLIEDSKHYIFIENQFFISITDDKVVKNKLADALYERIIKAHREEKTFRVYVILPLLPAFEGEVGTPHGTAIQAVTHWNYSSICRGGKSLLERLVPIVSDPFKYISFYGLRTHEELQGRMATELVYVHSKLMIVDDFSVIIGSANLNDRSLKGDRDSELAIIVQDTQTVSSTMNGQPYMAGAFASSLRKNLFREHLGVTDKDMYADVTDPICDAFYKKIWIRQASINTGVYEEVFHCIPSDRGTTFKNLKEYQAEPGLIDTDPDSAKRELRKVKGHLVLLPLQFLKEENLAPARGTKESLAPTVIWT